MLCGCGLWGRALGKAQLVCPSGGGGGCASMALSAAPQAASQNVKCGLRF